MQKPQVLVYRDVEKVIYLFIFFPDESSISRGRTGLKAWSCGSTLLARFGFIRPLRGTDYLKSIQICSMWPHLMVCYSCIYSIFLGVLVLYTYIFIFPHIWKIFINSTFLSAESKDYVVFGCGPYNGLCLWQINFACKEIKHIYFMIVVDLNTDLSFDPSWWCDKWWSYFACIVNVGTFLSYCSSSTSSSCTVPLKNHVCGHGRDDTL